MVVKLKVTNLLWQQNSRNTNKNAKKLSIPATSAVNPFSFQSEKFGQLGVRRGRGARSECERDTHVLVITSKYNPIIHHDTHDEDAKGHHPTKKDKKVLVVVESDAIVHKKAVMIHF